MLFRRRQRDPYAEPSLDTAFEAVMYRLSQQDAQLTTLDQKANIAVATAGLLVAGVAGLQNLITSTNNHNIDGLSTSLVIRCESLIALAMFVSIIYSAWRALSLEEFLVVPAPKDFWDNYRDKPPAYTKRALLAARIKAFEENEKQVQQKATWTDRALTALLIEACVLAVLVGTTFLPQGVDHGQSARQAVVESHGDRVQTAAAAKTPQPAVAKP